MNESCEFFDRGTVHVQTGLTAAGFNHVFYKGCAVVRKDEPAPLLCEKLLKPLVRTIRIWYGDKRPSKFTFLMFMQIPTISFGTHKSWVPFALSDVKIPAAAPASVQKHVPAWIPCCAANNDRKCVPEVKWPKHALMHYLAHVWY